MNAAHFRSVSARCPPLFHVISMKYPKLAAAIDEALADLVHKHGEEAITWLLELATVTGKIDGAPPEVLPPIPVTKELVLSEQTEVRNGN